MSISEAQKRATRKYIKSNYEFITVRVRKGQKDEIKAAAAAQGKSINQYIIERL